MPKRVTFVEINIFERMLPLASGYLQAYATADPDLASSYSFRHYSATVATPFTEILGDLSREETDLFAFSCYVWNMGTVRSLLRPLLATHPHALFLLGGPQVMGYAERYLDPETERMLVCNGEGERTFRNLLRTLREERPDFSAVKGLSFYRGGRLHTTEPEERIASLDEIPSPFLAGVFQDRYRMAVLETNRGCPFRCAFCYWGAATNDRVYKFDVDRVREEISWLSDHDVPLLYIADANWGMLKRDVELARHIADCKQRNGVPFYVYFAAAKNSPHRVEQIAGIFQQAGMLNTQPVSLQSLSEEALEHVDRKNIKLSAFETLQEDLNSKEISSYIELIWPLPGETLATFKKGLEKLVTLKASHVIAYPHMLLHNTPLSRRKEELGLVTRPVGGQGGEAELIIQTADVDYEEFTEGLRCFYAHLALYNTRVLYRLAVYLQETGRMSYADLLTAFSSFCRANGPSAFASFCEASIEDAGYYEMSNYPTVYHLVLHETRDEFERLLYAFASRQEFWTDERARFLFEIDMLAKPFVYSNTESDAPTFPLEHVSLLERGRRSWTLEIPARLAPLLEDDVGHLTGANGARRVSFELDHRRRQQPLRAGQTREENAAYCSGTVMRIGDILPTWTPL